MVDLQLDTSIFKRIKGLHGNWMAYARLLLPDVLPETSRIIYLDADVIVRCDIAEFPWLNFNGSFLAGFDHTALRYAKDREMLDHYIG